MKDWTWVKITMSDDIIKMSLFATFNIYQFEKEGTLSTSKSNFARMCLIFAMSALTL